MIPQASILPILHPNPVITLPEKELSLITEAKKGDLAAFRELIEMYSPRIYSIAYHLTGNSADAQDIAQEVFIKLHGALDRFNDQYRFAPWLYRLTLNAAIDYQRKQAHGRELQFSEFGNPGAIADNHVGPEALFEKTELLGIISRLTGLLSKKQSRVFVLRDLQGFSTPEIAKILQCSEITVRVHLANARTRIKNALVKFYPEFAADNP